MKLENEQMVDLAQRERGKFEDSLVKLLRDEFPEARQVPDDVLKNEVSSLIKTAENYGLTTEKQAVVFVISAAYLGADFDRELPAARKILLAPDLDGDAKAEWLREWTPQVVDQRELLR